MRTMPNQKHEPAQEGSLARRGFARAIADDALGQTGSIFAKAGFADPNLVLRWAEIAGAEVARVTTPIRLTEGPEGAVLTLKTEPGAAVFLEHETRALMERVNAYLGANRIRRIRLAPGQTEQPSESPVHPGQNIAQSNKPDSGGLSEALARLARLRDWLGR